MDRRGCLETNLRSLFLPWLDQVTTTIYVSYGAHLAPARVVSFPEFRPGPLGLNWELRELCRDHLAFNSRCVSFTRAVFLCLRLGAATFNMFVFLPCDDVIMTVLQGDTQQRSCG